MQMYILHIYYMYRNTYVIQVYKLNMYYMCRVCVLHIIWYICNAAVFLDI